MLEIVIEGTKGAGKTTAIAAARQALEARGLTVAVHAPFADGNARYADRGGIFLCWRNEDTAREALDWLADNVAEAKARAAADGADVLLYDRHWLTVMCAVDDTVLSDREKYQRLARWKTDQPPTVFLHCAPELTLERRAGQLDRKSGLDSVELVVRDYERRLEIARMMPGVVLLEVPHAQAAEVAAAVVGFAEREAAPSRPRR